MNALASKLDPDDRVVAMVHVIKAFFAIVTAKGRIFEMEATTKGVTILELAITEKGPK